MKRSTLFGIVAGFVLVLLLIGCAPSQATPVQEMPVALPTAPARYFEAGSEVGGGPSQPVEAVVRRATDYMSVERLIVRNATLDIVVPDTEEALDALSALVKELGGYIVESSVYQYQEGLRATLTFRVPAERLDEALARVRALASEVRSESVTGQDVTEEYVDLESRLRHLEATQKRLEAFLEEAEDTQAALAVLEQLRQVDAEIEQVKGRMQYLQQAAALSMVTLTITPDELAQPIQVGGWRPQGTVRNAFEALIRVLQFLVDALIVIVILIVPVLIVIAAPIVGLVFLIRAIRRHRRARKASVSPPPSN